jgi:hypothetical protein
MCGAEKWLAKWHEALRLLARRSEQLIAHKDKMS